MPSRNTQRFDVPDSYYHAYSRGLSKSNIFIDDADKAYFLYLFSRHLSAKPVITSIGYKYPNYRGKLELISYCLMDNHFHILFYQHEKGVLSAFMKSVLAAYVAYFNRKYKRTGTLFESRYKASRIDSEEYLLHVSRYIHLNPRYWKFYPFSSINYLRKGNEPEWLQTEKVLNLHKDRSSYIKFVRDYEANKKALEELKYQLIA